MSTILNDEFGYRITIRSVKGDILTYRHVSVIHCYDCGLIEFGDPKTDHTKRFAIANCEIECEQTLAHDTVKQRTLVQR